MKFLKILFFVLIPYALCAKPIHAEQSIKIGGIEQWIKLDGVDEKNPVLLFLHGGPGNSAIAYANKFTSDLQKHFIVVQWDQRETGKTKEMNHSPLSIDLFESDAVEVINYLRQKLDQEKIYLAGHSWGGFLALYIASRHPELLSGCFAAAPMVHQVESEAHSLEKMKEIAMKEKNENAVRELNKIKIPFENGEQLYFHRKWLYELINKQKAPFNKLYVENWADTWLEIFNSASRINFFETAPEIQCPVYFLVGAQDYQTNFELTKSYFEKLRAPKKELFWFTKSAHSLNLTESAKFQQVIISTLPTKQ